MMMMMILRELKLVYLSCMTDVAKANFCEWTARVLYKKSTQNLQFKINSGLNFPFLGCWL